MAKRGGWQREKMGSPWKVETKEGKMGKTLESGDRRGKRWAGHDLCIAGESEEMVERSRRTRKSFVRASSLHSKGNVAKEQEKWRIMY